MEDSSSFIYQTFWKDGKHCYLLDLTWTESHSFGISAPTLPEIFNGFLVLWDLGGAVTVSISQTRERDGWGCERQARSSAWVHLNAGSTREEHTQSPLQFQNQAPWAFCSHLFALALLPLSLSCPPPSLYMSSWLRHKDSVFQFQMILTPPHALFCSFSHSLETEFSRKNWNEERIEGARKMGERDSEIKKVR